MDYSPYVSVPPSQGTRRTPVGNDELRDFVSVVLADTKDTRPEFQYNGFCGAGRRVGAHCSPAWPG
jgi:hypothetical protein